MSPLVGMVYMGGLLAILLVLLFGVAAALVDRRRERRGEPVPPRFATRPKFVEPRIGAARNQPRRSFLPKLPL